MQDSLRLSSSILLTQYLVRSRMLFCVPLSTFFKNKIKKKNSLEIENDYEQWKQLFEAAKTRKHISVNNKENEDINLFINKYCLDQYTTGAEHDKSLGRHQDAEDSFEDTVSWQYFDVSESDDTSSSSSSSTSLSDSVSSPTETSYESFLPNSGNCSTLRQSSNLCISQQ